MKSLSQLKIRITLRQFQIILGLLSLLFVLGIMLREWPTRMGKDNLQWGNNNLDTFHRELIETHSGYQQQIPEKDRENRE